MKISKTIGAGVLSLGLVVGLGGVSSAMSGVIDTTGPDSYNKIEASAKHRVHLDNDNDLDVDNDNDQEAKTGDAKVFWNTTGGGARSGDAENDNSTRISAHVNNSPSNSAAFDGADFLNGGGSAKIHLTGPDSYNKIEVKKSSRVNINNNNDLDVRNDNDQYAKSGDAKVFGNTTGGSAVSGDARNTNTTTVDLRVTN